MGAYSPSGLINKELDLKIIETVIKPTFEAIKDMDETYKGFLYVGLMIRDNNPYLVEYNVRMGDPECQVILPRLNTDIVKIFNQALNNKLYKTTISWKNIKCMSVVLCAIGYPGKYKKNIKINNFHKIRVKKKSYIFHAGTKENNGEIFSNGGRVLNITSTGRTFMKIRNEIA